MRLMVSCRVLTASWMMVGCGGMEPVRQEEHPARSVASRVVSNGADLNGADLNGADLNGRKLNGGALDGQRLESVDYAGARLESKPGVFDAVWLEGSTFHGWHQGQRLSGLDFLRARFTGNVSNGSQVELRVDNLTSGTGENQDVWTYRVSYREPESGQWHPLCRNAQGEPVDAIAVAGRWDYRQGLPGQGGAKHDDPTTFTFACEGAAIAKCIRIGYKPWASIGGVNLAAHHQACTRLIRADYCGDGTSHTVDGQWVNIVDGLDVQQDTENWALEAEWDTEGARCLTTHNRAPSPVSCQGSLPKTQCGTEADFSTGTLLRSETP